MSEDSPELEALFDSIAQPAAAPAKTPAPAASNAGGDNPELEALFDSIASEATAQPVAAVTNQPPEVEALLDSIAHAITRDGASQESGDGSCTEHVFSQIGHMTRSLHDMLRELGVDKAIEKAASDLPDNRDRLNYIATMTAQAAERTLTAAEAVQPIQDKLGNTARDLASKWDRLFSKQLGVDEFRALVKDTQSYLHQVPQQTEASNAQLMEIIMAQDFQDLTGQVIKKVLEAAQNLEKQLIALLVETTPEDKRVGVRPGLLEGPIINAAGRSDVVTSQEQVDELLESLGF
ncbi:chemotaxis protein CheZ [Sulfuritortus calidifontis]|uniref:Protein phosphatase CheZ n=1 Tax=Sulfuritortus calidifontis TaxID=1914471 RepID=A0A4R3K0S6_9PROT|nr:protein phosphatase CheZ [Sulfuritortus calidifontis]TCS73919.1 chemotaxis protein CheZ [Sulfuritortus calidifontis]